jgi:hypothetical protein
MLDPDDPRIARQAEEAARRFEEAEQDRWLRIHSFAYRHRDWFSLAGGLIALIGLLGVTVTTNSMALDHHYTVMDGLLLLLGLIGAQMIGFANVRPDTRNWSEAVLRLTAMMLGILVIISVPGLILLVFLQATR